MPSSNLIVGGVLGTKDNGFFSDILFQDFDSAFVGLKHGYGKKAAVTINSIFYPYSCDPSGSVEYSGNYVNIFNMPHFLTPASGAEEPTVNTLHPFASGHDVGFTTFGSGIPEDSNPIIGGYPEKETYRGIALKGPLVITGPCYDTNGNPYPAGTGDGFIENYRQRPDLWATGPVDLRFNPDRGVFEAGGGGGGGKIVKILNDGNFPIPSGNLQETNFKKVYKVQEYTLSFENEEGADVSLEAQGQPFYAGNFRNNVIKEGKYYTCLKIGNKYAIDNQASFLEFT